MDALEYAAYGAATLVFGLLGWYVYTLFWEPIKGGRLMASVMTIFAQNEAQGTHKIIFGVPWDITGVVASERAQIRRKAIRHRQLVEEIGQLKALPEEKRPKTWQKQLQLRQLYVIALYQEIQRQRAIGNTLRIIVVKTLRGQLHFLVQHHNLKPLNECATYSTGFGAELIVQIGARLSRGIVRVQLDDIPEPVAQYWRQISNIKKRGAWHFVYPLTSDKSHWTEPPARFAVEALLSDQKYMRLIEMEKVFARRERNMGEMMERAKNDSVRASMTQQELEWAVAKWTGKGSVKVGGGGFTDTQTILITAGGAAALGLVAGYFSGGALVPTAIGAGAGGVFAGLGVREFAARQ